jgi:hypothetical protein
VAKKDLRRYLLEGCVPVFRPELDGEPGIIYCHRRDAPYLVGKRAGVAFGSTIAGGVCRWIRIQGQEEQAACFIQLQTKDNFQEP